MINPCSSLFVRRRLKLGTELIIFLLAEASTGIYDVDNTDVLVIL